MHLHDLKIWTRSIEMADTVHTLTKSFPKEERYGITQQVRKASVSVASNIAEGSQRTTDKDFANFILIAKGSLAEVQTQLLLSFRFGYLPQEQWHTLCKELEELHRMLHAFHSKLLARNS